MRPPRRLAFSGEVQELRSWWGKREGGKALLAFGASGSAVLASCGRGEYNRALCGAFRVEGGCCNGRFGVGRWLAARD